MFLAVFRLANEPDEEGPFTYEFASEAEARARNLSSVRLLIFLGHCRPFEAEYPRLGMRCREKRKKVGDVLPVKDSYHYPLPRGLAPGTRVRLVSYDHGYWTVEADGERYSVFGTLVDAGFDYELEGRWLPASDARVMARKQAETQVEEEKRQRAAAVQELCEVFRPQVSEDRACTLG